MYSNEYHILESIEGDGTPLGQSRDGRPCVFVFSDAEAARQFAISQGHADDWRSVQLNAAEMLDWIRESMATNHVSAVWTDPKAADKDPIETSANIFAECVAKVCGKL